MTAPLPTVPPSLAGVLTIGPAARDAHAEASGILSLRPAAVATPTGAAQLADLVRWAADHRLPLVPRGAGTGMPGGNVGSSVAIDLVSHFRDIVSIDAERRLATVQPGVTLAQLNAEARPLGLHFPVDPSSGARCTFGGMIANNSAGAHSVRYGATRQWVQSLDVVLASGTPATLTRGVAPTGEAGATLDVISAQLSAEREQILAAWPDVRKNSSGYAVKEFLATGDLLDLLIGSEGTLALITGATVKLAPTPASTGLLLLEFSSLDDMAAAVLALRPMQPATCELLDRTFLELVREGGADGAHPLRAGLEAILLVECAADHPHQVAARLAELRHAVGDLPAGTVTAIRPEHQARLWELRHAASPLIAANSGQHVSMQFIEDCVVPLPALPDYIRFLRTTLARFDLPAVIFGHAGDGNLHVNPLVDVHRPDWRTTVLEVLDAVADEVARLGGTLAGEHGDGRLRAPLLERIWGGEMVRRFERVKQAFDPLNILNPGVVLPLPGQHPLDGVRDFGAALHVPLDRSPEAP